MVRLQLLQERDDRLSGFVVGDALGDVEGLEPGRIGRNAQLGHLDDRFHVLGHQRP
jgi:hypothetical protein